MQGIYKITCEATGKFYVGSSRRVSTRWAEHLRALRIGTHFNPLLQRAWVKYGSSAFSFSLLEEVGDPGKLIPREEHYIRKLKPFFNINEDAQGGPTRKGMRNSAEQNAKIAAAHRGMKASKEAREKMRRARLGKSPWNKGKKMPPSWNKGIPWSTETREKLRASHLGKKLPRAQKRKISASLRKAYAEGRRRMRLDHDAAVESETNTKQRRLEPSLSSLRGAAPGATGDLDSVGFVRRGRGG